MKLYLLFILLVVLLISITSSSKLIYMTNIFRHGARYPLSDIFDGNQTKSLHGQLTTVGLRQQYLLGNFIRADYITKMNFLNSTLFGKELQVFTDMGSVQRCIYSVMAHLLGLYQFGSGYKLPDGISSDLLNPPFEEHSGMQDTQNKNNINLRANHFKIIQQKLKDLLSKQIGNQDENADFALNLGFMPVALKGDKQYFPDCPQKDVIMSRRATQIVKTVAQFQAQHAAFTEKMALIFKLKLEQTNIAGMAELYDVITCDKNLGRSLPMQFTDDDYRQLKLIQNYLFVLIYGQQPSKVFSTPYMNTVLSNFDRAIKQYNYNSSAGMKKISIFSRHDTDIVGLLDFLNLTSPQCIKKVYKNQTVTGNCAEVPEFASNLIFEFYDLQNSETPTSDSNFGVKIRYNGKYLKTCNSLTEQICSYDKFKAQIESQLVDFKKVCKISNATKLNQEVAINQKKNEQVYEILSNMFN